MHTFVFEARLGHLPVTILDSLLSPSDLVDPLADTIVGVPGKNLTKVRGCGPERRGEGGRE